MPPELGIGPGCYARRTVVFVKSKGAMIEVEAFKTSGKI